ncbi:N-acetylmuramoyl-L-alanine amidase [Peptoniphilus sp. KCTC 25270]|uniref:peptidoglycan recognition protein family protein n=1 Tax=Peptoniphilus sp. KCTC 25270 TaxID=2897414 RepID=UPI001E655797|nr:peptidoglycan recognition family protein [Peptoniphilus sp. KCTC 25270]MCD1148042.1 N-acetylmuramoyl-L-alanine amidase [Peptoniphilus sp. KCTC 25270]
MILDKRLIHYNFSKRGGTAIRYLVIHDTGNVSSTATALNHYRYFAGGDRQASAHYFVDQEGVVQIIEDAQSAWHCGDGRGRYGITNSNSIGIEFCVNRGNDEKRTLEHLRELVRELMKFYGIPRERVVRHYDASRKICPGSMRENNWAKWWGFWESL